ncbi:MAG: histone deacetylase family protein [Woeseiaceae bacterium]
MLTVYSNDHQLHRGKYEFGDGQLLPCFETPARADLVLKSVREANLGNIVEPEEFGLDPVLRIHDPGFVEFLGEAWDLWAAAGRTCDALPLAWPVRGMRNIVPEHIDGKLSYYSFDGGSPIMSGTWQAVRTSANVALTGAAHLRAGEHCVFSLCRPPGHHASSDYIGGYCYLNNAAIAAQSLLDEGASKIAILDIDYHHGNGTQSIFYDRSDVLFVSIHGDPAQEYPYFLGRDDETGDGKGVGFNANFPLRWQSSAKLWLAALEESLARVTAYAPDYLLISLGVDTFIEDPISEFRLTSDDYLTVGQRIASLGLPMQFILEGGYAVDAIGVNATNVLRAACEGNGTS